MENQRECIQGLGDRGGTLESRRYYQCRKTLLEMLADRGYDVVSHSLSRDHFRSLFGQQPNPESLSFSLSHLSNPSNRVQVIFAGTDDIRKQTILGIYKQIVGAETLNSLILVVQSKMTSFARKELENCRFKVEIIRMNDLLVNITKHVLQPKYEVLTADEKKALLAKYSLEDKQLPYMLKTDAIARYYGLEKGQVIKITYSDAIVESLVAYRRVV
ncbi:hypothetical protein RJT34_27385 [Clitoria ternatea]|uniref:Uncharacterized protein n=1 Tax=Clitoria ternatea TaxID=43366 RepID=A0AAN9F9S9_CLITE